MTAPAAGKTGTTNDTRDAWFAGFTPRLLAVVWVGFDDGRSLRLTGSQAAIPIWTSFMQCSMPMEAPLDFVAPPGVLHRRVDLRTGLLDDGACPADQVVTEVFVAGTEPTELSPCGAGYRRREPLIDRPAPRTQRNVPPIRRKDGLTRFFENLFGSGN
jgi:membrane carboxypeptidase/penicillin-binding protein